MLLSQSCNSETAREEKHIELGVDTTHLGNQAPVVQEVTQELTNGITQN